MVFIYIKRGYLYSEFYAIDDARSRQRIQCSLLLYFVVCRGFSVEILSTKSTRREIHCAVMP